MSVTRLKIVSDSIAETVVHPTWSGRIEYVREDDEVFFMPKLVGDIQFKGAEYVTIKDAPDCELIDIFMEELCDETWSEIWRGDFTKYDVKFNENTCVAILKPEIQTQYDCFNEHINEEYVISVVGAHVVHSIRGNYQVGGCCVETITDPFPDPLPIDPVCDVPADYCFDHNSYYYQDPLVTITSCFHRIRGHGTLTEPPTWGTGWTHLALTYWWRCPDAGEVDLGTLDYGRRLDEVLVSMYTGLGCGGAVKSHLFGVNNDHAAPPSNVAYTFAAAYMQDLTVHQKSDVKCPDCSDPAESFVWKMTWKKLLDDFRVMFNAYWTITDDGDLIIEHISYFEAIAGVDISTQNIHIDYGKSESGAPNIEKFHWVDNATFSAAHAGEPIIYGDCGTGTKDNRVQMFSNDVFYIRQVENQAEIADTNFCLVSCVVDEDDKYYILERNDPMGWVMLHDNLHRHNRYFEEGTMNGDAETFETVRKTRKLEDFAINSCCDEDFNPENYITTSAGQVTVTKATVNYFSGTNNRNITIESNI